MEIVTFINTAFHFLNYSDLVSVASSSKYIFWLVFCCFSECNYEWYTCWEIVNFLLLKCIKKTPSWLQDTILDIILFIIEKCKAYTCNSAQIRLIIHIMFTFTIICNT